MNTANETCILEVFRENKYCECFESFGTNVESVIQGYLNSETVFVSLTVCYTKISTNAMDVSKVKNTSCGMRKVQTSSVKLFNAEFF